MSVKRFPSSIYKTREGNLWRTVVSPHPWLRNQRRLTDGFLNLRVLQNPCSSSPCGSYQRCIVLLRQCFTLPCPQYMCGKWRIDKDEQPHEQLPIGNEFSYKMPWIQTGEIQQTILLSYPRTQKNYILEKPAWAKIKHKSCSWTKCEFSSWSVFCKHLFSYGMCSLECLSAMSSLPSCLFVPQEGRANSL